MNKKTKQTLFFLTLAFVAGMWMMYWLNPKINPPATASLEKQVETVSPKKENKVSTNFQPENPSESIDQLTQQDVVIDYLKVHKKFICYVQKGLAILYQHPSIVWMRVSVKFNKTGRDRFSRRGRNV